MRDKTALIIGLLAAALLALPGGANAADITSSGPLRAITVDEQLNCQLDAGDDSGEWFSQSSCGTYLALPGDSGVAPLTPVDQTAVTGSGTDKDPYSLTTTLSVGDDPASSVLTVEETDTYVTGARSYDTTVRLENTDAAVDDVVVFHGGDCYFGNSDSGYGYADGGTVGCTKRANSLDGGAMLLVPKTTPSNYFEGYYGENQSNIDAGDPLPDHCDCDIPQDNGQSLSWTVDVPSGTPSSPGTVAVQFSTEIVPADPTPTTGDESVTGPDTAELTGTVAANGKPTTWWFEYGTSTTYDHSTPHQSLPGSGFADQAVSAEIAGLVPGQTYHYRVVAQQDAGPIAGDDRTFTFSGTPTVATGDATAAATAATVDGSVDPNGSDVTWWFQYGTDPGNLDGLTLPQSLSGGASPAGVSAPLAGLSPTTTYYYRLVAASSQYGLVEGDTRSFRTSDTAQGPPELPPPTRGTTANAAPVKGTVLVKLPAGTSKRAARSLGLKGAVSHFIPLEQASQVPMGSTFDTTKGTVGLTTAAGLGKPDQTGSFRGSRFRVTQPKKHTLTTMSMKGGGLGACHTKVPHGGSRKLHAARRHRHRRRLFSSVHGRFRTRGRNASATVRGTKWTMTDTCRGTLTSVKRGVVVVHDFRLRKKVVVKAHHHYMAKAKPKRRGARIRKPRRRR